MRIVIRAALIPVLIAGTACGVVQETTGGRVKVVATTNIVGDLVRRAAAKGVDVPILRTAATALEVYEAKRAAGS